MSAAPSRRMLAGVTAATLLFGGLALADSASAEGPCPTYTDPAGDSALEPTGTTQDDDLDILAVSHSVDDGVFTTVIKLKGLTVDGPAFTSYDRFSGLFTVAKKPVIMQVDRDFSGSKPVITTLLTVAAAPKTTKVTAVLDLKASTVTLGVAVADLETAVGASLAGEPFSAMTAKTRVAFMPSVSTPAQNVQLNQTPDTATAPATASYLFGGSCSGGGTPLPTPTATPTVTPPVDGPPPLFAFPRNGCVLFKDAATDAFPGKAPVSSPISDGDLDFTAAAVRSDPDAIVVFAKITALATEPETPPFDGHKFTTSFVINGKTITAAAQASGAAVTTPATAKATAKFDTVKSYVVFTFPKADLATAAGVPLTDGTPITALSLVSNALFSGGGGDFDGDKAAGTTATEKSYTAGDNTCFKPPPAIVTLDTTGKGVYSDRSIVDVTVTDVDENALAGVTVQLQLTGMPVMTLTADDDGIAEFIFPITVPAGTKTLAATFLGNANAGPAGAGAPFTVAAETTLLKAVAGRGNVTATLIDNDKPATPVAGRQVAFKVGTKVTKVTTNAKGVAVLSRLTKGATVTVSFAGTAGKYLAAKAVSAKVL